MAKPQTKYTEQHVLNDGYDEEFGVLAVELLGYDGARLMRQRADASAIRYDPAGYVGYAKAGADPAAAVWQIVSLDTSNGVIITYANGSANYDQIWDDRASLAYS